MFELSNQDYELISREDLMTFLGRCFDELNPNQTFSEAPYLQVMAATIAESLSGRGSKRLIVNLPPRFLKSITVSVAAVAWILGRDPSKQIICASYGQDLAEKHALDTRTLMLSSFYSRLFPRTVISKDKRSTNDFMTTAGGFRMATSVGGVLTGRGGDIIIIDDPLKPDDALSSTKRGAVNNWFDNTVLSRLNNKEEGIIIVVMQRLHEDDLVGHVQIGGETWEVLSFPAIAEEDERRTFRTFLGEGIYQRKTGAVLDPSRESLKRLLDTKQLIGNYTFSSQYQQNPIPVGGAMVMTEWLQYYDIAAPLPSFSMTIQSWDTANKAGELNDYTVCTTWGFRDGSFYLLHVERQRYDYPTLKRKVMELSMRWSPNIILIEDKASGTQLIQDLKADGVRNVKPYAPLSGVDKVMRLHAQTAEFESGHVFLPSSAPWLECYVKELTGFPGSKFDDQVDSTTQALDHMKCNRSLAIWTKLGRQARDHQSRL